MPEWLYIIILTGISGACIPIGGVVASIERLRPRWLEQEFRHFVIAFGGGILLGAVAVVLVPEGLSSLGNHAAAIWIILAGGLTFFLTEKRLGLRRRESPQLMGLVLDYVPEAIALGGLVTLDPGLALLLAILIGLQNLPEGFNAYRELKQQKNNTKLALFYMMLLVPIGPIAGLLGYYLLTDHKWILGVIMLFSAGGILYLIFQEIAPQSRLQRHWAPPLGAVLGFCMALYSRMLMHGS